MQTKPNFKQKNILTKHKFDIMQSGYVEAAEGFFVLKQPVRAKKKPTNMILALLYRSLHMNTYQIYI